MSFCNQFRYSKSWGRRHRYNVFIHRLSQPESIFYLFRFPPRQTIFYIILKYFSRATHVPSPVVSLRRGTVTAECSTLGICKNHTESTKSHPFSRPGLHFLSISNKRPLPIPETNLHANPDSKGLGWWGGRNGAARKGSPGGRPNQRTPINYEMRGLWLDWRCAERARVM